MRRFLSRWTREITCVSRHLETWLRDEVRVRAPVTQVYNGVDTETFRPADGPSPVRAELGLGEDAFVAGIVGRLDPIKDHSTLFRAFAPLAARDPAARLLVVGDGGERARIEKEAGDGVVMLGERADVAEVLRALDVFVLPSHNEGISNTILEAMASGVPVVASRVGGNPELVEDGRQGRLFPAGDVDALASCLQDYAGSAETRLAHGAAGRARCEERFSIPVMVRGYADVWERAAAR